MNKKGDISDNVYWILNISLVAIIIFLINLGLGMTTNAYADTKGLEYSILNERVINSLLYIEPISGATQTGMIDIKDFTNDTIKKTIASEPGRQFGIRVSLEYNNLEKEIFFNKQDYEDFRIFRTYELEKNVVVMDDGHEYLGKVKVEQAIRTRGLVAVNE